MKRTKNTRKENLYLKGKYSIDKRKNKSKMQIPSTYEKSQHLKPLRCLEKDIPRLYDILNYCRTNVEIQNAHEMKIIDSHQTNHS